MRKQPGGHTQDESARILLRAVGSVSLLAFPFVFVPQAWMEAIHGSLGMGELPNAPVVDYLARSTSFLYAWLGGTLWLISMDLPRYRPILRYFGLAMGLLGPVLFVIDWQSGMPMFWRVGEGPAVIIIAALMLFFSKAPKTQGADGNVAPSPTAGEED